MENQIKIVNVILVLHRIVNIIQNEQILMIEVGVLQQPVILKHMMSCVINLLVHGRVVLD